jgi:tight adherence protein B
VAEELAQMHVPVQPSEYIAFQLLAIVVLTCLFCTLLGLSIWPALLMAIISVQLFKRIMVRTRKNKNLQLMNKQLPEVCRLMANSLRAGLTITQAFELIARELASPAGKEFFNMHREMELGAEFDNVLMRFQQRIDSRDIVLFAGVVINQRKIGGNLVQVLEHMAKTLQERLLMQEAIKTMTAESKYISYILPIVPVVLLVMMNSLIEGFLQPLYTVPGLLLLASFIAVQAVAFVTVSKISGFKV